MWTIALNGSHEIAIAKLMGNLEISKNYAVELALNKGLFELGVLRSEDYTILDERYKHKLVDMIAENKANRENSHIPKLELEKQKREKCQASVQKLKEESKLLDLERLFKGILEQWDEHPLEWKIKQITYAKKHSDLKFAKLVIDKENECDIISQISTKNTSEAS
jgi:hypothetical protein